VNDNDDRNLDDRRLKTKEDLALENIHIAAKKMTKKLDRRQMSEYSWKEREFHSE